jgi:AraC-like DNA-binding protein
MINRIMRPLHPLVYALATWKLLYNYKDKIFNNKNRSYDFVVIKKWLLIFSGFVLAAALMHLFIFLSAFAVDGKLSFINANNTSMVFFSVIYVLMLVSLLVFPHILYGMPTQASSSNVDFVAQPDFIPTTITSSIDENDLIPANENQLQLFSEQYLQEINNKISSWSEQQLFLDSDSSIVSLAAYTQITQHHLSYYFNTHLAIKFTDWRNNLKVDYAKLLLDQDITTSITMEALAIQCGFSSQTTFNRAFKNSIGVTPSQYGKLRG